MTTQTIWGDNLSDWMTLKSAFRDGYFPHYSSIRSVYKSIERGIYQGLIERVDPRTGRPSRDAWVNLPRLAEAHRARGYRMPNDQQGRQG